MFKMSLSELLWHLLIGAQLGLLLGLYSIIANVNLYTALASSPSPRLAVAMLVGVTSSMIAVGYTATGLMLNRGKGRP